MKCTIKVIWDDEAKVWYTDSDDISGLVLENESFDALIKHIQLAAPEMLEINCGYQGPVHLIIEALRITMGIAS